MTIEAMKQARQVIWRYRHETPIGNQPHMIAHEADQAIERIDQAIAEAEKQEPAAWWFQFPDKRIRPKFDTIQHGGDWKPLYAHPQPKREYMCSQTETLCSKCIDVCEAEKDLVCVCGAVWQGDEMVHMPDAQPKAEKQEGQSNFCAQCEAFARELKGIKEKNT